MEIYVFLEQKDHVSQEHIKHKKLSVHDFPYTKMRKTVRKAFRIAGIVVFAVASLFLFLFLMALPPAKLYARIQKFIKLYMFQGFAKISLVYTKICSTVQQLFFFEKTSGGKRIEKWFPCSTSSNNEKLCLVLS